MRSPKKHLPIVGLVGLVVLAATGGGVYYYQFVLSHTTVTYAPSHRMIFMTAIVEEEGGFHIFNTAFLNQTGLPAFDTSNGYNLTGVMYQDYQGSGDNKTIDAHPGDKITFYIKGLNATGTDQSLHQSNSHGFDLSAPSGATSSAYDVASGGVVPGTIPFGKWYSVTVTFNIAGVFVYRCSVPCSPLHGNMNGNIVVR